MMRAELVEVGYDSAWRELCGTLIEFSDIVCQLDQAQSLGRVRELQARARVLHQHLKAQLAHLGKLLVLAQDRLGEARDE